MASTPEFQHTVGKTASFSGTALHTGDKVTLKLQPAPVDHGIKFKRKDLQDEPTIDVKIENLKTVERATTIGEGSVRVHTVEHILAALSAMGVDNAIVEMDANEPPIGDGSAQPYVDLIKRAGVIAQEEPRKFFHVREPMHVEAKTGALLVLLPDDKFRISCTQAGPNNRFTQFLSIEVTPAFFERALAREQTRRSAMSAPRAIPTGDSGLDTGEVMKILPHRYPFLMVDRVVGFEGENKITAIKSITINEPFFQGHFPGHPVMPGVMQVEAMAQVASILLFKLTKTSSRVVYFMSADQVKFRKPVFPGDTIFIHAELTRARGNRMAKTKCYCVVNDAVVSEAELMFTFLDK